MGSERGRPRLHTTQEGYFREPYLWDLLVRRLCLECEKLRAADPRLHHHTTAILEFSRGSEHGGYARAFQHLSWPVVDKAAVLYLRVSFAESLRKNRRRFNPLKPHSILEHSLPDEKLGRLYREDDWDGLSAQDRQLLSIHGYCVPYAIFENEDDLTTPGGEASGERLEQVLGRLWDIRTAFRV